jgi:hypothetical protein
MPFPECHGKDCKVVSYEIRNFAFRGAVLNADKPQNEWQTTAAAALSASARDQWTRDTEANLRTVLGEQGQRESTPCAGAPGNPDACRCAIERSSETEWVESRHEYRVNGSSTGTLVSIGVATYEYRRIEKTGKCMSTLTIGRLEAPQEFFAVYLGDGPQQRARRNKA